MLVGNRSLYGSDDKSKNFPFIKETVSDMYQVPGNYQDGYNYGIKDAEKNFA